MYPYIGRNMSYAEQSEWFECKIEFLKDLLQESDIAVTQQRLIKKITECIAFRDHLMDLSTGTRSDLIRFTASGHYDAGTGRQGP